jgi:hypothetical protein
MVTFRVSNVERVESRLATVDAAARLAELRWRKPERTASPRPSW